jgi:hypothetical protein
MGMRSYCPPNYPITPEKSPVSKAFTDIDGQALDALIARVSEAKDNQLALSGEDCQLLLDAGFRNNSRCLWGNFVDSKASCDSRLTRRWN